MHLCGEIAKYILNKTFEKRNEVSKLKDKSVPEVQSEIITRTITEEKLETLRV